MDTRKRGRAEFGFNANGGFKKSKPEIDSLSSGIGSKSKPCTKFFSMAGCPFGENCHFLHYFPGGYNAVAQMMNLAPGPATRTAVVPPQTQNGSAPAAVKTKLCNKYSTAEGCKYHDKCHFAHGEWELGKPIIQAQEDPRAIGAIPGRFAARAEPPVLGPAGSFGASATAKISVDASLAGAIIGKGGVNSKQISWQTGAKLAIREHETDPNLRNIELEGVGRPGGHAAQGRPLEALEVMRPQGATSRPSFVRTSPKGPAHLEIGAILRMGQLSYAKQGFKCPLSVTHCCAISCGFFPEFWLCDL
ncbi:UNVERIFIED_CONTAM: Zinc finger CCCH domain-containing protein 14 [Sesamum radiatum]|uniref:Zinc finger CCCH domain-containing protein 14 n=1 Tax=Sesamum radiatum TaxID=300843 RepID=A0AAW2TL04_SESRA